MKKLVFILVAMLAFTASASAQCTALIKKIQQQTEQKVNRAVSNAKRGAKVKVYPKIGSFPLLGPSKELKSAVKALSSRKALPLPTPDNTAVRITPDSLYKYCTPHCAHDSTAVQACDSINAAK
ncbi:hypothetical protein [Sodaliphilus sp.]|uniref:hypothetical protein n=1 Tax=Sodaliphilus sp. TaxID=2815818 RepID=UPI00388FCEB6